MNVLILGNGGEERTWAEWFLSDREHRLIAVFPGFSGSLPADIPVARDLDDALARVGIDVVIVGGPIDERGESLRRAAAEGLAIICLHPPGADSEAYYQVALSRSETGAVIVPDLPLRLHPGVDALRQAMDSGELGALRGLRLEFPSSDEVVDLARVAVPRAVDVIRALIGEIEALTATGDPPGEHPDIELVVQLRATGASGRATRLVWLRRARPAHPRGGQWVVGLRIRSVVATILPFDASTRGPAGDGDGTRSLGSPRGDLRGFVRIVSTSRCCRLAIAKPSRRHPSHGAGRSDRAEPPSGTNCRPPLRADQRGSHLQVGHDVDGLHDLARRTRCGAVRTFRTAAGLQLDDLHCLPDSADSGDLRCVANIAIRRKEARSIKRGDAVNRRLTPRVLGPGVSVRSRRPAPPHRSAIR